MKLRGDPLTVFLFAAGLVFGGISSVYPITFPWVEVACGLLIIAGILLLLLRLKAALSAGLLIAFCGGAFIRPFIEGPFDGATSRLRGLLYDTYSHELVKCSDCPEMVAVPLGSFLMGSPDSAQGRHANEGPVHTVTIGYKFEVAKFPVTVGQFRSFVKDSNYFLGSDCFAVYGPAYALKSGSSWQAPAFVQTDDHPVTCVNWDDAKAYLQWLSKKTGSPYRLLSEAEREYVTRAGTTTPYWFGTFVSRNQANYNDSSDSSKLSNTGTVPAKSFEPNSFGLYQVHGNIFEWAGTRIMPERRSMDQHERNV